MNHIFRVLWNAAKGLWQAVSELGTGRVKSTCSRARRRQGAVALLACAASSLAAAADPLPVNGQLTAGQAAVSYAGTTMTVNQSSQKAVLDWKSFSIGQGHTVNFVQPSASSVALNRVLGTDPSIIQGALNSNGHVFLINPNGVLFSPTAQVNVGGLLASTLSMGNGDFLAGRYQLSGTSTGTVANQGTVKAAAGGNVALVAARVQNSGTIEAEAGKVLLGAGSEVLVDFGGPVKLLVQKGAVDALVENGGAIRAAGGAVLMTAKSADELTGSVINHSGIIQARTLATGERGEILLLGDMRSGTLNAGGLLDASAPYGGNGGAIETSAAYVNAGANLVVNAGAAAGKAGDWLLDPYDYAINAAAASTITGALNQGTNVTVTTQSSTGTGVTGSGSGDITVSSAIAKTAGGDASLTLRADRNIVVNADITSTSGKLNLTLSSANAASATVGGVNVNANLSSNGGDILIGGANGTANGSIAYALNTGSTAPAITLGTAKSILSNGGDITINGRSLAGSNNGNYSGTTAGVYIRAGATIRSGTGNLLINGESDGGVKTFGLAFEGGPNTVTTLASSLTGGSMLLNAVNATPGNYTPTVLNAGAIGLVSFGGRDQIVFQGPSVAAWLVYVNGAPQLSAYTQAPQLSSCAVTLPNCGTMVVPGSNNSYLYATYQAVDMATRALFITQAGAGTKIYDGNTAATGLSYTATTDIANFSVSNLIPAPGFATTSKNVGTYTKLVALPANPTHYTTGGNTYAVGYFNTGSFTITPKSLTPAAASKVYDGDTTAAVSVAGVIAGDVVTASGSGTFGAKNVGTYSVNVAQIALGGADAGNYSLSGNSASAVAQITPRTVTLTGSKIYDGSTGFTNVTLGNLVAGEDLLTSGATANSAQVLAAGWFNTLSLQNGASGLSSNYQLPAMGAASASNNARITPKALAVNGLVAANKVYDGTTAAALSGGSLSGMVGSETLNLGSITGGFANKNVGSGKAVTLSTVSLTDGTGLASNYAFSQPAGLTADISARALTVSGIAAADKVYDGTTVATVNAANAVLTGLVAGDIVTANITGAFADARAANGKAVTLTSNYSGADSGNYAITNQASSTASITPKALLATGLSAADKVYDGSTAAAVTGATLAGLIGGETLALSGLTGTFANKNAGTGMTVMIGGGLLTNGTGLASDYSLSLPASVTASITRKALTVTGVNAANKTYDGTTAATLSGGTLSGMVGGETLTLASLSGAFADKNAASDKAVSVTGAALADGTGLAANYTVANPAGLSAAITSKALTVSGITAANKVYDGSTAAMLSGATLSGLVAGDSVTVGATGAFADKNAAVGKVVNITSAYSGADLGNYVISGQASTVASITQKALIVTGAIASNKIYDGSTSATVSGGSLSGLVDGEMLVLAGLSGTFTDKNAGSAKAVSVTGATLANGTGLAANYTVANPSGLNAAITGKTLTVTGITAANKVYDGTTAASVSTSQATLAGLVTGDSVTVGATGTFADRNAAAGKVVNLTSVFGGADAGNYAITGQASTLAGIAQKALSVTGAVASNKVYDGTTTATLSGGSLSGLVGAETLVLGSLSGAFDNANAGTGKAVTVASPTVSNGSGLASNYLVEPVSSLSAAITPKALVITGLQAADKTYDGTTAATLNAASASLFGLVGGQTLGLAGGAASFADKNVGADRAVTVSGIALVDGTGSASNYTVAQPTNLTARITPKALTVSGVTAASKTYDGSTAATVSTAGSQLDGLVDGDAVTVAASGAFSNKNAGAGKTVLLTITQSGADAGNYAIAGGAVTTATITPKAVTISGLGVADKTADGTTAATIATPGTLAGLIANDNVSIDAVAAVARFAQADAGSAIPVSVTGMALRGADAANYAMLDSTSSTGTILPAAASVPAPVVVVTVPVVTVPAVTAPAVTVPAVATPVIPVPAVPAPVAAAVAAASAATAPIILRPADIASSSITAAVGGLAYVAVADSAVVAPTADGQGLAARDAGANPEPVSATQRRQSSRQEAGDNRGVKYLDVMVVSGGIRMPSDPATDGDKRALTN